MEDGSTLKCENIANDYASQLDLRYFYKSNTGPGDSRNFGAAKATGDYLVFFDSDCIIPVQYFTTVNIFLSSHKLDTYGGPDKAPSKINRIQEAINYAMTSFITTGGIRGNELTAKSFLPRSFNMGVIKPCFDQSGGFSDLHPGEDPDLIYRLIKEGYSKGLISDAYVYHKRRLSFSGFAKQVYKFGLARTILMKWHKDSRKWVYYLPTIVLLAGILLLISGLWNAWLWYLLGLGALIIFFDALFKTKNLITSLLAPVAVIIQISCYGWGFLTGWWNLLLWGRPEKQRFPEMFKGSSG